MKATPPMTRATVDEANDTNDAHNWWSYLSMFTCRRARVGPSDGSGVDVNCKGSLGDQSSVCSVGDSQKKGGVVIRKESAETQEHVSCQDTEVDDDKNLEGVLSRL